VLFEAGIGISHTAERHADKGCGEPENVCLNLKPTRKLVIMIEKKDENDSSTNATENFIAEKDGKFVIPVPGPCR